MKIPIHKTGERVIMFTQSIEIFLAKAKIQKVTNCNKQWQAKKSKLESTLSERINGKFTLAFLTLCVSNVNNPHNEKPLVCDRFTVSNAVRHKHPRNQ
jgi:hypothetical protein